MPKCYISPTWRRPSNLTAINFCMWGSSSNLINYASLSLSPVFIVGRDPENSVLPLTLTVTFTTAKALPSSAVMQ